jgi:heme/copper-type cytochrome/quinol oxidase subunit 3
MPSGYPEQATVLPVGTTFHESTGLWGMLTLITTVAALFAYLLFSYFYVATQAPGQWPPSGPPRLMLASINTCVLLASSACVWWADRAAAKGAHGRTLLGLAGSIVLGILFVGLQLVEWRGKSFSLVTDPYGSLFFTITGFHMVHVIVGILMLAVLLVWTAAGLFTPRRHAALSIGALYWHFVDAVWLAVFSALYLSAHAH